MSLKSFKTIRPRQLTEVLLWEVHPDYSRDPGQAKAGVVIELGQVLGRITAAGADKGKLVPWDPAASDGSEDVVGASMSEIDPDQGDDEVLISARSSLLRRSGLRFKAGADDAHKAAALAGLAALGVLVRNY